MSQLLHQLQNNEAVLLMYVAGELPEEERREVEAMLKSDAKLREMYDDLRMAWGETMAGVDGLDARDPVSFSRDAAARQVGRMVRSWHAARMKPVAVERVVPRGRLPWWAIAASSVAAGVIGFLVWWGHYDDARVAQLAAQGRAEANPAAWRDGDTDQDARDRQANDATNDTKRNSSAETGNRGGSNPDAPAGPDNARGVNPHLPRIPDGRVRERPHGLPADGGPVAQGSGGRGDGVSANSGPVPGVVDDGPLAMLDRSIDRPNGVRTPDGPRGDWPRSDGRGDSRGEGPGDRRGDGRPWAMISGGWLGGWRPQTDEEWERVAIVDSSMFTANEFSRMEERVRAVELLAGESIP